MSALQTIKIPILTYHSIDMSGSVISTNPDTFRNQMKFLSEMNFNVVSLKTLGKHFLEKKPLPPKTIVLTFDDGFQNFYTTAFPVLSEYNFTATVFLITDYCGKFNDWSGNLQAFEPRKLMSWNEIKELSKNGIEFAAHSKTHLDLTRITIEKARREMVESKSAIENNLRVEVTDFAYPYGKYDTPVKRLTEEHFRTACSVRLGKTQFGDDLFSLKRLDAYYLSNERIFRAVLSGNFDWYMSFRQAMRDIKRRVIVNSKYLPLI
jgi:peptidoglycan/xylan/chitin deacetylase (PgdA/CDA1 family)